MYRCLLVACATTFLPAAPAPLERESSSSTWEKSELAGSMPCLHGDLGDNGCTCFSGWEGSACDLAQCGRGQRDPLDSGKCICVINYSGEHCEICEWNDSVNYTVCNWEELASLLPSANSTDVTTPRSRAGHPDAKIILMFNGFIILVGASFFFTIVGLVKCCQYYDDYCERLNEEERQQFLAKFHVPDLDVELTSCMSSKKNSGTSQEEEERKKKVKFDDSKSIHITIVSDE